jgi:hypothetical protein
MDQLYGVPSQLFTALQANKEARKLETWQKSPGSETHVGGRGVRQYLCIQQSVVVGLGCSFGKFLIDW